MRKDTETLFRYLLYALGTAGCLAHITLLFFAAPRTAAGIAGALLLLFGWGFLQRNLQNKHDKRRGWGIIGGNRDTIYYREWRDGRWEKIEIYAELLAKGPHRRAIHFISEDQWKKEYPPWAVEKRWEIMKRIKSEFPPGRYTYLSD